MAIKRPQPSGSCLAARASAKAKAAKARALERKSQVRSHGSEVTEQRRELRTLQRQARRALSKANTARRRLGIAKRSLKAAQSGLARLRKQGKKTAQAAGKVDTCRRHLQEASGDLSRKSRDARAARASRKTQELKVSQTIAKRTREEKALKVETLRTRQLEVRKATALRLRASMRQLHARQSEELRALQAAQAAQRRVLVERQKEACADLRKRSVERLHDMKLRQEETSKSYRHWLASDESLHADKFKRCVGGSLGRSLCILRPVKERHQYTLVYLHQFNCEGHGYAYYKPHYFYSSTKFRCNGLKIVLPTAQTIPITAHDKEEKFAWYDYLTDYDGVREDKVNMKSLRETRDRIFRILDHEIKLLNGDASRVFIGGASQGCCTALHCALQYPQKLGGFVGIVGHLLSCTPTPSSKMRMPISLYNGLDDRVMRWPWVRKCYQRFKDAGYTNVRIHREPGVGHDTGPKEREWLVDFLARCVKDHGS